MEALRGFPACDCPAVHVLRNGSIVYWCQPIVNGYPGNPTVAPMYISESWGSGWVRKETTLEVPGWIKRMGNVKLDDPTLWVDRNGNWHALAHNGDGPNPCGDTGRDGLAYRDGNPLPVGCSAHLYSRDGLRWTMSPIAAHNATVALRGGGQRELFRQRPKVLVTERGDITYLFGGVMPCGERDVRRPAKGDAARTAHCTSARPPPNPHRRVGAGVGIDTYRNIDNSWTSVVPLRQPGDP